LLHLSTKDYK